MNTASEQEIKVLILEDEPTDAELVERTLRKAGLAFVAENVATRSAFVEALDRFKPDIVLSDYKLPDFDGLAALMLVRDKDPRLPVIVVSGVIGDEEAVQLIRSGADDYVLKDRLARLPDAVRRALADADLRRQRDRQEQAARAAAAEIADLYNNAPCGYHSVDKDNVIVRVNDTELSWLGYTREEVVGKKRTIDLSSPGTRSTVEAAFAQFKAQRRAMDVEFEMVRKDGTSFPVTLDATAVTDRDGNFVMSRSMIHDLTERKQAEQGLRESEERFRAQSTAAQDAMITLDDLGHIVFWNESASRMFGYAAREALGQDFHSLLAPARYLDAIRAAWPRFAESGEGAVIGKVTELVARRKDGAEFPVELSLSAVTLGGHWHALGVVRDLTERKRAEEALRNSEQAYRDVFELSPDAVVAWKANAIIEAANDASAALLGYDKAEEMIGKSWLDLVVPEDFPARAEVTRKAEQTGGPFSAEFSMRRRDGSHVPVEGRLRAALDAAGNPVRTIAMARDITERKRAEHALQRLNRTLRTLSAANTAVVRAATEHDLLDDMCRVCVDSGGYLLAWIGFVAHDDAKTVRPVAWAGEHTEYVRTANLTWEDNERGRGPGGMAIRSGEAQINQNIETNPGMELWRSNLLGYGFRSCVALPLKDSTGVFGILGLYAGEPDAFGPEEVELLNELASDLCFGIQARRDRAGRDTALAALQGNLKLTVQAVANAVEMHDVYTAGHERHVADLSVAIARELGLTEWLIDGLFLAGLIHDVGKINVPAEFLSKPGKLSSLEYQLIQTHVQAGYDIIKDVNFPWPVAQSILQHHERLDGSGYPNHLKGDAISIEGKILGVADTVDAMQSHRPYRAALGLDAALAEIQAGKGRLYDPAVVDACVNLFRQKGFRFK